jgi:hypothetical protein
MELCPFYIAMEIRMHYGSTMMAMEPDARETRYGMSPSPLAHLLLQVATHVTPKALRKHPRGPKLSKRKGYVVGTVTQRHVSMARVLKAGIVNWNF